MHTALIGAFAILAMSVIGITVSSSPIFPQQLYLQNVFAQNDESQTGIEQRLGQKNLGSGESSNFNCVDNTLQGSPSSLSLCQSGEEPPEEEPTGAFTISGQGSGLSVCGALAAAATIEISAQGAEDGTVTGTLGIGGPGIGTNLLPVNDGTTDGNTFSLSGEDGLCSGPFTLSGNCGTSVAVSYEDDGGSGTFTGDVECTLA